MAPTLHRLSAAPVDDHGMAELGDHGLVQLGQRPARGQPGTAAVVAEAETDLTVPGIADPVATTVFRGDSARLGYTTRALLVVVT
jgi:hypothetical protein